MADLFWLSDEQWAVLEPFMPKNQPGARRVDDRRVISGIVHVLKSGGRWRDCPAEHGPHTTLSQPLQQMVPPRLLARHVGGARASWVDRRDGVARQHLCQGTSLCARRQRGAKAQAIGHHAAGRPPSSTCLPTSSGGPPSSTFRPATPAT
jgi:transposase